ncbi:S25 ribosomal protein-domain-containing protein [Syncephalastrum racemosum]|uniref:40S ribosomal protein S25 n=1 Tax=Syncephalastrum racemosum TaxID=13706 RepID=A0A1X2HDC6_SYNRA|nr:S25 ribosomal protein-domain-containing protein [Syncephalastrum racemosum]
MYVTAYWTHSKERNGPASVLPLSRPHHDVPTSSSGGKKAKKKWSAKKVKDKANNMVVLDKPTYERLFKEVPTYKLISQSVLVDRLRMNGSLARVAIKELEAQGLIKPLVRHRSQLIYTRATGDEKKAKGAESDDE